MAETLPPMLAGPTLRQVTLLRSLAVRFRGSSGDLPGLVAESAGSMAASKPIRIRAAVRRRALDTARHPHAMVTCYGVSVGRDSSGNGGRLKAAVLEFPPSEPVLRRQSIVG